MKELFVGLMLSVAAAGLAVAGTQKFDFKDPKGVNTVTFRLDATLEAISGSANGIAGEVQFDPQNPSLTKGRITIETGSMHVPNPMMKEHMHGKDWLDVSGHPNITFECESVSGVKTTDNVTTADVSGKLTIKGVTRPVIVPVKFTFLKDKLGARTMGRMQGDLLVMRADFVVKRSDYGINPKAPVDNVSDDIQLTLSLAGSAPRA